ncbi:DUF6522 family protein [Rhodopseudomonas pseudopalustris]|uniref:Uncharacterized protein n=1 Tax=Rhodopseudomonas pseudopalustris TaxID=1513892 RepID=A0A1H8XC46_9BRAD|nr:DUF6522 family protein [Rhodopseudomonas pseudopalustris]SEP37363.1 hypothetical protein SAMN05444123_11932 [Rhodopseudomonas pseudopalustris]
MQVEIADGNIIIDANLLAPLLQVAAAEVPALMRAQAITSICERGIEEHEGHFRLSFFYRNRRVRLRVDPMGRILQRMTVDFGDRTLPAQLRRPGP